MVAVSIQPASTLSIDALVSVFNLGYSGYIVPVNVSMDQFQGHLQHNDIDLTASQIVLVGEEPVGVCLLGVRKNVGWIGGLGVHPDYRRQGLGRQLMHAVIQVAKSRNINSIILEVIVGNDGARQLYLDLDFVDTQRLLILERQPAPLATSYDPTETADIEYVVSLQAEFHANAVAWQHSKESLLHKSSSTTAWLIHADDKSPSAYAIGQISEHAVHWLDIGCAPGQDKALQDLITGLHQRYPDAKARIVNIGEAEPAAAVLMNLDYQETLSQHEMCLSL